MQMFIESQRGKNMEINQNSPYIPTLVVNGVSYTKPEEAWDDEDNKKNIHDKKAKNILASSLGMDEFFGVSNCQTAK